MDDLEAELRRRAMEGTEKPVYFRGEECGVIRNYSDALGMFLLKGRRRAVFGKLSEDDIATPPSDDAGSKNSSSVRETLEKRLSDIAARKGQGR